MECWKNPDADGLAKPWVPLNKRLQCVWASSWLLLTTRHKHLVPNSALQHISMD